MDIQFLTICPLPGQSSGAAGRARGRRRSLAQRVAANRGRVRATVATGRGGRRAR